MKKMTIREAADFLGVSRQTISNYILRGLLNAEKDSASKRFFVNGDDIGKLAEEYKHIASAKNKVKEIVAMEECLDKRYSELRKAIMREDDLEVHKEIVSSILCRLYDILSLDREYLSSVRIYRGFLEGKSIKELSRQYYNSERKVCLLLNRETAVFNEKLRHLDAILADYKKMKREYASVKAQLNLDKRVRIVETTLSNRAKNSLLRAGLTYVDELWNYGIRNLLDLERIGKGTIVEIADFIEKSKKH